MMEQTAQYELARPALLRGPPLSFPDLVADLEDIVYVIGAPALQVITLLALLTTPLAVV